MVRPSVGGSLPFVGCATAGLALTFLPPDPLGGAHAALALTVFAAVLGFLVISVRRRRASWVDPMPVYLFYLMLAIVIDGTGGSLSTLIPLSVLGVMWSALYGTRTQVYVVASVMSATLLLPMLLVGPPLYPGSQWPRMVLWILVAAVVGPAVHDIVRRWHLAQDAERTLTTEVEEIMRGSRLASMISTHTDGTIKVFGVGAERLLGYSADEMVGRHTPGVFHDADEVAQVAEELGVEPGFAVFAELGRRAAPSRIWRYVRQGGEQIFVRLAISELHDGDGTVSGYLGVAIDESDAIRTHRELAAAQARWSVAMDSLPDTTVLTLDEDLRIGLVTGGGATAVGLLGAEGQHLSSVTKAENLAILARLVSGAFEGEVATGELLAATNGHEHELLVTELPLDGSGREALVLARDVSTHRARERAVVRSRDRAERLFEDSPHGIVLLSTDGVALQVNPALCEELGRSESELLGSRIALLSQRAGDTTIEDHLKHVVDGTTGRSQTKWVVRGSDASARHVMLSSTLLRDDADEHDMVLMTVVDISARERYEEQLAHLADHDPLTGLANRRRFDAELERHMEHVQRYGPRGAVLMLDLDNFKVVNDTLGHGTGDQLIVSVADVLRQRIRTTDVVARLGGDEFAVLLSETDPVGTEDVAADLVRLVREHVASLDGAHRQVTVSIGAMMIDSVTLTPSDIMSTVDMMLYDAKDAGRDRHALLDPHRHELPRTGARMRWNERIETALAEDRFELHLQPILDLSSGQVTGAEALLRMREGDSLILPGVFLYVAERSATIVELDSWVIRHSVALLAELQRINPQFRLEVNLSGKSVGDARIEQELVSAIDHHRIDPSGLVLEITETAAVAHIEEARQFADRITQLGCRFALDDFGAGFGSFYYLKHLVFDYIKIDGEFVDTCDTSPTDRTIVSSIVQMARGLGKETIAEFVSRPEILGVVETLGVDHAQGYDVGHPMPSSQFLDALRRPRLVWPRG